VEQQADVLRLRATDGKVLFPAEIDRTEKLKDNG
jgi:hypothetical protein